MNGRSGWAPEPDPQLLEGREDRRPAADGDLAEYGREGAHLYASLNDQNWRADVDSLLPCAPRRRPGTLELGCGAGRVLRALWAEGRPADGVERSGAMLSHWPTGEAGERRGDVYHADFTSWLPDRLYSLVFASRNTLGHLLAEDELARLLVALKSRLAEEGRVLVDLDTFGPGILGSYCTRKAVACEIEGRSMRIETRTTFDLERRRTVHEIRGESVAAGRVTAEAFTLATTTRLWTRAELERISAASGYRLGVFARNYGRTSSECARESVIYSFRVTEPAKR